MLNNFLKLLMTAICLLVFLHIEATYTTYTITTTTTTTTTTQFLLLL